MDQRQPQKKTEPAVPPALLGSNQSGMRERNERLVLSLIRTHGALAKAQIARMTKLSAQTVSVIMRRLENDGLLVRGEPVRGKVGQPSIPMSLAPEGALFLGLKIGRRSMDLVLTNFLGEVKDRVWRTHLFPTPDGTIAFAHDAVDQLVRPLDRASRERIAGLGIAMPFFLWNWAQWLGVPDETMAAWRTADIRSDIAARYDFPVILENDATAACGAELVFGPPDAPRDFLYFFVGFFIGGGVVLNGALYTGPGNNAGALGPMPVPGPSGETRQLIDLASLSVLERALQEAGQDTTFLWEGTDNWTVDEDILENWIDGAGRALAYAVAAAVSLMDFQAVTIDGGLPAGIRARIVERCRTALSEINLAGLNPPEIREGSIGPDARALGAASLPLSRAFLIEG